MSEESNENVLFGGIHVRIQKIWKNSPESLRWTNEFGKCLEILSCYSELCSAFEFMCSARVDFNLTCIIWLKWGSSQEECMTCWSTAPKDAGRTYLDFQVFLAGGVAHVLL